MHDTPDMPDPYARTTRGYLGDIPPVASFRATPASILARALAWFIDIAVIWAAIIALIVLFGDTGGSSSSTRPDFRTQSEREAEENSATAASMLLFLGYFVVAERITGKTVGKKLMNIKVVNKYDGEHVTIWQSIGRNLLRLVDFFPFGLIGLISMEKSDQNQRVGDRAMGTIVITDKKPKA